MDHHPLLIPENIVPLKFSLSPHSVPPDIWYGLSIFPGFTLWILLDKFLQFVFPQYSNFRIRNALKDLHNIPMTPFERTLTIILNSILPLIFVFQTLFIMSKQLGIPNPPNPFSGTTKEDIINEIIILGEYLLGAGVVMIGRYAQSRYWEWILWSFRLLERVCKMGGKWWKRCGPGKKGKNQGYWCWGAFLLVTSLIGSFFRDAGAGASSGSGSGSGSGRAERMGNMGGQTGDARFVCDKYKNCINY